MIKKTCIFIFLFQSCLTAFCQIDNYGNEISLTCDTISLKVFKGRLITGLKSMNKKDSFSTTELLEFIRIARTIELEENYESKRKYRRFLNIYGSKIIPLVVNDESMEYVQQMGFVRYSMRYKMFISKPGRSHTMLCHNYYFIEK